jgi:hypothetical protein
MASRADEVIFWVSYPPYVELKILNCEVWHSQYEGEKLFAEVYLPWDGILA